MKVQIATINSNYDETTGLSKTTILTDLGSFEGVAKLHPDDAPYASHYAGCRFAEQRALIKYAKMKVKVINSQLEVLKNISNELRNKKHYKENNGTRLLEKNIYILEDDKKYFADTAKRLAEKLKEDIETRDKFLKEREEKKQSNE
jgi:hypothetical protein